MKKNNDKLGIFILSIFLIIILILIGLKFEKVLSKQAAKTKVSQNISLSTSPDADNGSTKGASNTSINIQKEIGSLSIPILMYHHIRDYNDPSDQLGINLSVTPNNLGKQLDLIQSKGYLTTTFTEINAEKNPDKPIILTFDDGYLNFYQNAYPELKKRGMKAVVFIIANDNSGDYMNEAEIKELSGYGIEIGSHTLSHPNLTNISVEKAETEIFDSKIKLEKIISKPVISFCYPSGKYNEQVKKLVEEAGYKYAITTENGKGEFDKAFKLSRYRVNHDTNINGYLNE